MLLVNDQGYVTVREGGLAVDGAESDPCCCTPPDSNYYILYPCSPQTLPDGFPAIIAVVDTFSCGQSCPLNCDRVVLYQGVCYHPNCLDFDVHCESLPCAGGRCKVPSFPFDWLQPGTRIVTPSELICKPIELTCRDTPCVPVQPGCCSASDLGPCFGQWTGQGYDQTICRRPKRFKISRTGNYRVKSWVYDDPGSCRGYHVCEDVSLTFHFEAEFQCVEDGTTNSTATLRAFSGTMSARGYPPQYFGGIDVNGDNFFTLQDALQWGSGGIENLGMYLPFRFGFSTGHMLNMFPGQLGLMPSCNGTHNPGYGDDTNCIRQTQSCLGASISERHGSCTHGTLDEVRYRDCFLKLFSFLSVGFYAAPCPADQAWDETATDQTFLSNMIGCSSQPPQYPPAQPESVHAVVGQASGMPVIRGIDAAGLNRAMADEFL